MSRLLKEGSNADEPANIALSDYSSLSSGGDDSDSCDEDKRNNRNENGNGAGADDEGKQQISCSCGVVCQK